MSINITRAYKTLDGLQSAIMPVHCLNIRRLCVCVCMSEIMHGPCKGVNKHDSSQLCELYSTTSTSTQSGNNLHLNGDTRFTRQTLSLFPKRDPWLMRKWTRPTAGHSVASFSSKKCASFCRFGLHDAASTEMAASLIA